MPNYTSLATTTTVIRHATANRAWSKGKIAKHATNHENVKTTAAVNFSIAGVTYQKGATGEFDLSALSCITETGAADTLTAQATATDRAYLLVLNAAGTAKIIQGTAVATGGTCVCPGCPESYAPFAALKVANVSGSDFTLGTTALNAANVTTTYVDVSLAPATL